MLKPAQDPPHLDMRHHHQQAIPQQTLVWVPLPAHHPPIPPQQMVPHTVHHFSARNHSSGRFYKEQTHPANPISPKKLTRYKHP
ncbi:hypothetical protein Hanom_Chr14g01320251 [Helianthus anomalus]